MHAGSPILISLQQQTLAHILLDAVMVEEIVERGITKTFVFEHMIHSGGTRTLEGVNAGLG